MIILQESFGQISLHKLHLQQLIFTRNMNLDLEDNQKPTTVCRTTEYQRGCWKKHEYKMLTMMNIILSNILVSDPLEQPVQHGTVPPQCQQ